MRKLTCQTLTLVPAKSRPRHGPQARIRPCCRAGWYSRRSVAYRSDADASRLREHAPSPSNRAPRHQRRAAAHRRMDGRRRIVDHGELRRDHCGEVGILAASGRAGCVLHRCRSAEHAASAQRRDGAQARTSSRLTAARGVSYMGFARPACRRRPQAAQPCPLIAQLIALPDRSAPRRAQYSTLPLVCGVDAFAQHLLGFEFSSGLRFDPASRRDDWRRRARCIPSYMSTGFFRVLGVIAQARVNQAFLVLTCDASAEIASFSWRQSPSSHARLSRAFRYLRCSFFLASVRPHSPRYDYDTWEFCPAGNGFKRGGGRPRSQYSGQRATIYSRVNGFAAHGWSSDSRAVRSHS